VYDPASDEPRERPKRETPFNLYALSAFLVFSAGILYFGFEYFKNRASTPAPSLPPGFLVEPAPKLPVGDPEVVVDPAKVPQDPAEQKRFMASVWHQRALAAYSAHDLDTARTAWKRCLTIDSGNAACQEGLSRVGQGYTVLPKGRHPVGGSLRFYVRFDPKSSGLSAGNDAVLARVADTMELYPLDKLIVTGYATDEEGVDLAVERAKAVRTRLQEKGLTAEMSLEARISDGDMAASAVIQLKRK